MHDDVAELDFRPSVVILHSNVAPEPTARIRAAELIDLLTVEKHRVVVARGANSVVVPLSNGFRG